jgi:hypothetical protein
MDIVSALSNPGAVLGKLAGAAAVAGPMVVTISGILMAGLPPPNNQRTAYAIVYRWIEFASLGFGYGKSAARAQLNGEMVPATVLPAVQPVVVAPVVVPPVSGPLA